MPLKTAVPSACRISEPGPNAITRGQTPMLNANDVIRIGRNRNREASTAASCRSTPASICCLAYSTIRIAFLQARPTSTTNPIWVKILLSMLRRKTPEMAANRHMGTIRMMAAGSVQLSYCAASARNTNSTHKGKM